MLKQFMIVHNTEFIEQDDSAFAGGLFGGESYTLPDNGIYSAQQRQAVDGIQRSGRQQVWRCDKTN
jgi:hypothetical protein